ncbi:F-box protein At5g51380-like [Helianthus annuus]|uniref:F-box protein At5g51380-like n=1 Tax=Helianthus annuus TaxID=4232 RepID=UPI001653068A|nr:F-box protein At5g51380-like [Helianthus annuus]
MEYCRTTTQPLNHHRVIEPSHHPIVTQCSIQSSHHQIVAPPNTVASSCRTTTVPWNHHLHCVVLHEFEGGWLAALSYCTNLKTLKFQSCKFIGPNPGPSEHLGSCPTLEELYLERCQLRDKQGLGALFLVCEAVRDLVFADCLGLDNNAFSAASVCRRVASLSLEGCSLLTMDGFEPVVHSWKEVKRLKVVACNNIKDSAMSPELATLFSLLKELKWRPDSKSILSSGLEGLEGTGVWQRGGRSFKI